MAVPTVAVVIPVHDRTDELRAAVRSVLAQTTPCHELIVVDDGSHDDVLGALTPVFGNRIRVIRQHHEGVGAARNRGVDACRSEFVTFLDSDDVASEGWLAAMSDAAADGCDIWFGGAEFIFDDGERRTATSTALGPAFGEMCGLFLAGTFMIRRSTFVGIGGYRTDLRYSENTEFGLRVGERHAGAPLRVAYSAEALVAVTGKRRHYDPELSYEVAAHLLDAHRPRMALDPPMLATHLAIRGVAASRLGRRSEAIRDLVEACRIDPRQWRHSARLVRAFATRSTTSIQRSPTETNEYADDTR